MSEWGGCGLLRWLADKDAGCVVVRPDGIIYTAAKPGATLSPQPASLAAADQSTAQSRNEIGALTGRRCPTLPPPDPPPAQRRIPVSPAWQEPRSSVTRLEFVIHAHARTAERMR